MASTTHNFGLIKPGLNDAADITAFNGNWDKIDEQLLKAGESGGSDLVQTELSEIVGDEPELDPVVQSKLEELIDEGLTPHIEDKQNPHNVTAEQIGALTGGNVVNNLESDRTDLPLSAAQGKALKDDINDKLNVGKTQVYLRSTDASNTEKSRIGGVMYENNPMVGYMHDNASGKTVDSVGILFDGTNFYATGNKGGADTVLKKLGDPIYLGAGTSFNVSSYAGYKKFTVNNFFIQPSETISTSNWGAETAYTGNDIGTCGVSSLTAGLNISYNESTGVLSAYISASASGGANKRSESMKTASGTAAVKAYLIP